MKKKIVTLFLTVTLCAFATGCGDNASEPNPDNTSDKQLEELKKENEELKKQIEKNDTSKETDVPDVATNKPTMSSDFKKGTTKITKGEFTVDIPANWSSKTIEGQDGLYFYPSNDKSALLLLTYLSVPELESASDEQLAKNMDGWVSGLKEGTGIISIDSVSDSKYNGINVKSVTMTQKMDFSDELYTVKSIGFIANNGLGQIFLTVVNNNNINYSDDFESILNSLNILESETALNEQPPSDEGATSGEATMEQKNSLGAALDYLAYTAFSYSGLISQLEYEGYSTESATYAADNCGADWNEQAAKMAQDYISYSSFSRDGLIEQLEYEGFTAEQAEYGATAVGY